MCKNFKTTLGKYFNFLLGEKNTKYRNIITFISFLCVGGSRGPESTFSWASKVHDCILRTKNFLNSVIWYTNVLFWLFNTLLYLCTISVQNFQVKYSPLTWKLLTSRLPIINLYLIFGLDIVPVGIIAGGTVGSSILLLLFLLALAFYLYRQRKASEYNMWHSCGNNSRQSMKTTKHVYLMQMICIRTLNRICKIIKSLDVKLQD